MTARPAGLRMRDIRAGPARDRRVGEHEDQHGGVARAALDRQRFEIALAEIDVGELVEPLAGGLEHRGGIVHRDDLFDVRRQLGRETAGAAA